VPSNATDHLAARARRAQRAVVMHPSAVCVQKKMIDEERAARTIRLKARLERLKVSGVTWTVTADERMRGHPGGALTLLRACCRRWKQQQRRRASESERRATVERAVWRELWERSHFERAGEGVRTALLRGRSSSSEKELLTSRPETLLGPSPVHERQCSRTGAARPSPQPAWQWRQ
jgi:hypothetical protein